MQAKSDTYTAVQHVFRNATRGSWQRLNGALHDVLGAAIVAHLGIDEDDFTSISRDFRGGYWMGAGDGSAHGERYYNLAVEMNNDAACKAFEKYAGRPPALWAEKVKTASRLCVGSEFTWEGLKVKVTSMKKEYLVACTYKKNGFYRDGKFQAGHVDYVDNKYRMIEEVVNAEDERLIVRFGPPVEYERETPDKVLKIKYEELAAKKREFNKALKQALKEVEETTTANELQTVLNRLQAAGRHTYRHFDIEEIHKAIGKKKESFDKADVERVEAMEEGERLKRWLAGEQIPAYFHGPVKLRLNGIYIETTNGQSVLASSVRPLVPWALQNRANFGPVSDKRVDLHDVRLISVKGITVGCTLVPWVEIERLPEIFASKEAEVRGQIEEVNR